MISSALLSLILLSSSSAGFSPKSLVDLALQNNSELRSFQQQIGGAQADFDRVGAEFGPRVEAIIGVGPNTAAYGNSISASEDRTSIGRTYLTNIKLTQPLFAWGRKSDYAQAAEAGVAVKRAEYEGKRSELRFQVKEALFGYLFAKTILDFIETGKKDLTKVYENEQRKNPSKQNYKLSLFLDMVESKEAEANRGFKLAQAALHLRTGIDESNILVPANEWLEPNFRTLQPINTYLDLAKSSRSEFAQINSGIIAKSRLASAEKKAALPILAFLASYEWADTNVRNPQNNPFAYDPYNRSVLTMGIGFKWDFQWGLAGAKAAKLYAEKAELEAKSEFAAQGLLTDVKRAYWEVEETNAKLFIAQRSYKLTKKWLGNQALALTTGLGKGQEIAEAYSARAEAAKNYFEAIYRHHLAWAGLAKAVGREIDPIFLD